MSAQGYEIHSITARKFSANRNILGYIARHWFTKWLKNNGIGFKSVLFCDEVKSKHDKLLGCRRLGVDAMIEDRPMKIIQEWLGHSDMSTTANIYSHVDSESKKLSATAISTALGDFD